jgi:hypothetical protein
MRRPRGIPLTDAVLFRRAAGRTTLLLAAIVALAAAGSAWAIVESARLEPQPRFLPSNTSGIVVLDVSASISEDTYARIRETLRRLVATESRFGLVVFSDVAYEALPPGTPAAELEPFQRLFEFGRRGESESEATVPAVNPLTTSFSGGTRISTGLSLARRILRRDEIRDGGVLLISDLSDDRSDVNALQDELIRYSRRGVPLRVIALNPAPEDAKYFERLLGDPDYVVPAVRAGEAGEGAGGFGGSIPLVLLGLGVGLLVVLAVGEHVSGRLVWRKA